MTAVTDLIFVCLWYLAWFEWLGLIVVTVPLCAELRYTEVV